MACAGPVQAASPPPRPIGRRETAGRHGGPPPRYPGGRFSPIPPCPAVGGYYAALMLPLLHLAILTVTIVVLTRLLPSVRIKSAGTAVVVAIVFSVLNFFLGWFIRALLVVPALLTLGLLFLFVPFIVNTVLLWLTDKLLSSFE